MKLDPIETLTSAATPPASPAAPPARRARRRPLGFAAMLLAAATAGGWWYLHRPPVLPAGIIASNGRLEMDEIDIETKFPERVAALAVDEGAVVRAGALLARMDTADMEASLAQAQAQIAAQDSVIVQSQADLAQAVTARDLAARELARTTALVPRGFATQELLDQRRQALEAAVQNQRAIEARIAGARAAREAAVQAARLISVNIADNTITAPKSGVVQYRLANLGEVLPAGGKLFTLLDTNYVYMDVFLPTAQAGLAVPGREARIVLDARPDLALPAHVIFLSDQNQFTPKLVETRTERDKLMFRVRLKLDDAAGAAAFVQAGLPAMAYIRAQDGAAWPDFSQIRANAAP